MYQHSYNKIHSRNCTLKAQKNTMKSYQDFIRKLKRKLKNEKK